MTVPSCLVCSFVPLAAACGSHGTLSLLITESCVHNAVYPQHFFFYFCNPVSVPFMLLSYSGTFPHPMYRFWLYLALHIYDNPKSTVKIQVSVSIS